MTDLAPCSSCKRHVAVGEVTCPFCAATLSPLRAQRFRPSRLTRAAVFGAAIAACSDPKPVAPVQGSAAGSSEDLEKLLDNDGTAVKHADAPIDAATPDAVAIAAALDAGTPDAGIDAQAAADKRRRDAERRRREREKRQQEQLRAVPDPDLGHNIPKPYGAPPARRRTV